MKRCCLGVLLWAIAAVAGCQTRLHSMEGHVYFVPAGVDIQTVNHGVVKTRHEGVWMSKQYLREVWDVQAENANP